MIEKTSARPATLPLPDPSSPRPAGVFWRPNPDFLDELAAALRGRRVLEVFGGNGLLAAHLAARGVEVTCTTEFASHDAHELGLYHPVAPLDALDACGQLGDAHDVLLMCWPTTTWRAVAACDAFGPGRPIAYVGEFTDYAQNQLGGCATDEFFDRFETVRPIDSYRGNSYEMAAIGRLSPAPRPRRSARP